MEHRRRALVTGAARGTGRAIAKRLSADGLDVTVADLPSAGGELVGLAAALGGPGRALHRTLDVSDAMAVDEAARAQAAARPMIAQGRGGRIIGAGSVAAHRGGKWQSASSASNFAIRGLTQSLAQKLGELAA